LLSVITENGKGAAYPKGPLEKKTSVSNVFEFKSLKINPKLKMKIGRNFLSFQPVTSEVSFDLWMQ